MTDLIKRLEEAREPSRELDAEIAVTISRDADARVVWGKGRRFFLQPGPKRIPFAGCLGKGAKLGLVYQTVRYTSSVDAALSLVPEGWRRRVMVAEDGRAGVQLCHIGDGWPSDIEQLYANEALATCIASLRACSEAGEGVE